MSFFDLFRRKKKELPEEDLKWNKMWELWADEEAISPYAELMTYESEVNNGGHMQFFDNVSNTEDLAQVVKALFDVLRGVLRENIEKAYDAYLEYEGNDEKEDMLTDILDECDDVFYNDNRKSKFPKFRPQMQDLRTNFVREICRFLLQ